MSIDSLTGRDEITVFLATHSQDDMANDVEASTTRRRKLKCRLVPMGGREKIKHDIPLDEEVYSVFFNEDPELNLKHMAIYSSKVFDITGANNVGEQSWLWEATMRHEPGMQVDV